MKAPEDKRRIDRLWDLLPRADRLPTLFLAFTAVAIITVDLGAKASEATEDDRSEHAATYAEPDPNSAPGDYRLAPGDRVTIVVFDQPQLSGEFIVDGGGGVLLPLAGSVILSGLTLAEAQQLIQERFADGVLVQPAVSVRITQHRPIFVSGNVRKPGSYPFILGTSVKAAIATAGGEGQPLEQPFNAAVSDFITAEQRVRQLEADHTILLLRKARLEAQRDGRENFVVPLLVGFNRHNDFDRAYATESDTFARLADTYRRQVEVLHEQRPRIDEEISAVNSQIAKQRERLDIVTDRLTDLELLFRKGLLRKEVLLNQQIEKSLVEAQLSNLEAQVAHLRQTMGELDIKLGDLKAAHQRQTLAELQDASQRFIEIENSIGPARKLLEVKAQAAASNGDESDYTLSISRVRPGRLVRFDASSETMLSPGDVVEVKLKRRDPLENIPSSPTQTLRILGPASSVADKSE